MLKKHLFSGNFYEQINDADTGPNFFWQISKLYSPYPNFDYFSSII